MAGVETSFSITVGTLPDWYPDWQAPGVIRAIPNSSLDQAITDNGWTEPTDIVAGGTGWPRGLYSFSGGTVAYLDGQPYLCVCGGGHATHADNSIYAFGPLFGTNSSTPQWRRWGAQSANEDILTCVARNADGRPTSRHTVGDFSFGLDRIVMLWSNSPYCADGGTVADIDVFDVVAGEWDAAKASPVTHSPHGLFPATHSMSTFHPHTGLFYAKGKGARDDSFGAYDPISRTWADIAFSGDGSPNDCAICTMGPRDYLFFLKETGRNAGRINVQTGVGELWGGPVPTNTKAAVAYDTRQDRIYTPTTGVTDANQNMPAGSNTVAWLDAGGSASTPWVTETFHGDTPDQQRTGGTFGRWSYVPELAGFVLNNAHDSQIYFYRTSE
ncbi:MAG: hypothetical protein AAGA68_14485 [Pseudomonadota bacterium]